MDAQMSLEIVFIAEPPVKNRTRVRFLPDLGTLMKFRVMRTFNPFTEVAR